MSLFEAIILGAVQGITEFLPVSSSGHLIIIPKIFGFDSGGLSFDAFLHLATAFSMCIYFWQDWKTVLVKSKEAFFKNRKEGGSARSLFKDQSVRFLLLVFLGTFPVAFVGYVFRGFIEYKLRNPLIVVIMLLLVSFFMIFVEKRKKVKEKDEITIRDSVIIGLFQVIALIPGTSRSAITITGGMTRGISRQKATKFSFMLATPLVALAGLYSFVSALPYMNFNMFGSYIIGFVSAFFAGLFSIEFLLDFVKKKDLVPFALYRIVLALVLFLSILF